MDLNSVDIPIPVSDGLKVQTSCEDWGSSIWFSIAPFLCILVVVKTVVDVQVLKVVWLEYKLLNDVRVSWVTFDDMSVYTK